ncbi:HIT family protein [Kitasatospora sp. NPDC003701]
MAGTAAARIVRRWPDALALHPLGPVTPGHLLVIPLLHVPDVTTDPEVSATVMRRVSEIATPPCNVITSAGAAATQTVFHAHVHVLPRSIGDGLLLPWSTPATTGDGRRQHWHRRRCHLIRRQFNALKRLLQLRGGSEHG